MEDSLFVFDIDGTLIDSAQSYVQVLTKAFGQMGLKEIDTDFDSYLHHTDSYALEYNFKKNFDHAFSTALFDELDHILGEEIKRHPASTPIAGAPTFIDELRALEIPFGYATGAFPKPTLYKMATAGIWLDEAILATSINHITRETMVAEAIDRAQNFFNVERRKVISVGDGLWDLQTANNLGIDFIGIGNRNKEVLLSNGCQHWFENIDEMKKYLS